MPVNNQIYDAQAAGWWDENHFLHLLKAGVNPARFGYFHDLFTRLSLDPRTLTLLDIGCGGGILGEEFAKIGCQVTGLDPSEASLETARRHAAQQGLEISYQRGRGESLPFAAESFDMVVCCDVLEHVDDLEAVIRESARVLRSPDPLSGKPGGIFLFDTINRTEEARKSNIFAAQQFPLTSFFPPDTHAWGKFITPDELTALLAAHRLEAREMTGLRIGLEEGQVAWMLIQRKFGLLSFAELGRRLKFHTGGGLESNYLGWAVKQND
ncbi:MAG: 3-demethylubiquinone-9 3-O-methyltransferase [Chloroflexi bacterium]|nr:MAG: 3-demethylubiquinone-9 3-O-methyltransferase [Chloroflexota bacterium]